MSTHGSLSEVERFNLLYKSSFNKVCNFACFYVRNKQASEDITMDAFLQLLETMKVESVDNPMALLITIVKHKSLDYLKTQVRREDTKDDKKFRQKSAYEECQWRFFYQIVLHKDLQEDIEKSRLRTESAFFV